MMDNEITYTIRRMCAGDAIPEAAARDLDGLAGKWLVRRSDAGDAPALFDSEDEARAEQARRGGAWYGQFRWHGYPAEGVYAAGRELELVQVAGPPVSPGVAEAVARRAANRPRRGPRSGSVRLQ